MLNLLNIFFHCLHIFLIIFNVFGWLIPKLRKVHLISVLLTFISWFGLGIFYGWGYCPITDWHWQIQRELGYQNLPYSYIKLLLDYMGGSEINPLLIDMVTLSTFLLAFAMSIWINFFYNPSKSIASFPEE